MIIIYTFDFKKNASLKSKNNEYMMLVVSIQSALENKIKPTIIIYSGDDEFIRRIILEFGNQINIAYTGIKQYCNRDYFTCAGHARINAINEWVGKDDVLYVDNDTLFSPDALTNLKKKTEPFGYKKEEWNPVKKWIDAIKENDTQKKKLEQLFKNYINLLIINNGVQYYPKCKKSIILAGLVKHTYDYVLKSCGYNYGLDQLVFTKVMYDLKLGNNQLQKNKVVDSVWHAYCVKKKYIDNLKKIDMYSGYLLNDKKLEPYNKLEKLFIESRIKPFEFLIVNIEINTRRIFRMVTGI